MVISNFGLMIQTAQSSDVLIWVAGISAFSAIASATLVGYLNYRAGTKLEQQRFQNNDNLERQTREHAAQLENKKIEHADYQRMQQVYSELMGRKHMVLQSNASYFSEFIRSGFLTNCSFISASSRVDFPVFAKKKKISIKEAENELSQTINNLQENSMEFEIAREADTRSRELQLKLAESYERFWVTIGLIQVLFAATPYLENYIMLIEAPIGTSENGKIFENFEKSIIDRNLGFKSFVLEKVVMAVSGQSFENKELQDNAIKLNDTMILELKSKVNDFELRIDDLLNYLKAVMIARSQTF